MEIKIVFDTAGLDHMAESIQRVSHMAAHLKYGKHPDDPPASLRERRERGLPCAVDVVKSEGRGCR